MAKFDAYPKADTILPDDLLITDGTRGTKTVKASEALYKFLESVPQMHKVTWRGKNLGNRYTSEQQAAVANGTLTDIWLGDYWERDGVKWTIVDFEVASQSMQDLPSTYLTIMPDQSVATAEFLTSVTNVSMKDTHIYKYLESWVGHKFEGVFGAAHILDHSVGFEGEWVDGSWESMRIGGSIGYELLRKKIVLPNEIDLFGSRVLTTLANEQWANQTTSTRQFAALRMGWTPRLPQNVGIWIHARSSSRYYGCIKRNEGVVMDVGTKQQGICPYVFVR